MTKTTNKSHQPLKSKASEVTIPVNDIPGPDFTVYVESSFEERFRKIKQDGIKHLEEKEQYSYARSVRIDNKKGKEIVSGRGLACRAYKGNLLSITLRCEAKNTRKARPHYGSQEQANRAYRKRISATLGKYSQENPSDKGSAEDYLGYCPAGHPTYQGLFTRKAPQKSPRKVSSSKTPTQPDKEIFLNDIYPLCDQIYDLLLSDPTSQQSGLVVISGATDSSKSLITRGLIFLFLEAAAKRALARGLRKPHLITFEDPIEQFYLKDPNSHTAPELKTLLKLLELVYLDYTPREKDEDADNLGKVIKDSLRQTPAVLFVGETREEQDWRNLLEFAGSGHLVFTTSHASSVVEAMTRIFRDTDTRTPAQRSEIARRILGIINIRHLRPQVPAKSQGTSTKQQIDQPRASNVRALLPALWKSTSQSENNLIADGLASLLPALGREEEIGYYSRTYFVEKLTTEPLMTARFKKHSRHLLKEIERQAREWDIEGV